MQVYNEDKKYISENISATIDWAALIDDCWKGIRRFWMFLVLMILLCVNLFYCYRAYTYAPVYVCEKIYSVSGANHTLDDMSTVFSRRLAKSFENTMKYSGLKEEMLQYIEPEMSELPADISVSNVTDTNLLTITVSADNYYNAQSIMELFCEIYPSYANNIVGNVRMDLISEKISDNKDTSFPKNEVLIVGAFIGCLVCLMWMLIYAMSRKTVRTPEAMKSVTSLECLQGIPEVKLKKRSSNVDKKILISNRIVGEDFKSQIITLRRKVIQSLKKSKKQVLLVTSSVPGEGKTLIAGNLALSMAEAGYKVALLGLNWKNGSESHLNRKEWKLSEFVSGKIDIQTEIDGNTSGVVVLKIEKESIVDVVGSGTLKTGLDMLRKKVDYVIVDTASLISTEDTSAVLEYVDKVLYVVRQDHVYKKDLESGLEFLANSGSDTIGYVLNYAETSLTENARYGYGNKYGYGKYSYGKYGKKSVEVDVNMKKEGSDEE